MPEMRLATTGSPLLIASISTTGMPSRRPCFVGTLGATSTSAAASSAATWSRVRAPASSTRPVRPACGDRALEHRAVLAVADDPAVDVDALGGQQAAGLDEVALALDLVQRARRRRSRSAPAGEPARRSPLTGGAKCGGVDARADDVHAVGEALARTRR